eukprot:scaffold43575_cov41-Cyclotella_meneghiniana.AAC.1
MGEIVELIQSHGVKVMHIPAGCTYLCQPVDVGINRPLKKNMSDAWEEWMLEEGIASNKTPTRKLISEWILKSWDGISKEVVKIAWKKKDYSWHYED